MEIAFALAAIIIVMSVVCYRVGLTDGHSNGYEEAILRIRLFESRYRPMGPDPDTAATAVAPRYPVSNLAVGSGITPQQSSSATYRC